MKLANQIVKNTGGIDELKKVADIRNDSDFSLSTTPFGTSKGKDSYIPRAAVAWKNDPDAMPSKVENGLKDAQKLSKRYAGIESSTEYHGKVMPKKSAAQAAGGEEELE